MNRYQFERIRRDMRNEYGKIPRGREEEYAPLLILMEQNLLTVIREEDDVKDSEVKDAYLLALHRMNEYVTGVKADLTDFETERVNKLCHAVLMTFDPFTNEEVMMVVHPDRNDTDACRNYFRVPVICVQRNIDSADFWTRRWGKNGYIRRMESDNADKELDGKLYFAITAAEETEQGIENNPGVNMVQMKNGRL